MTSLRHNRYLDAARDSILDVGWRRTTLTEVARRADVSRMTIYRTWPDMQTLLADLMTREWGVVSAVLPERDAEPPTPASIAAGSMAVIGALRTNPLFRRILDVDPELLLPYLLDRRGRSQEAILAVLGTRIEAGQRAGTITPGDPQVLARSLLLLAHGPALSAQTMVDDAVTLDAMDAMACALLTKALTP